jgi:hypothetical protein
LRESGLTQMKATMKRRTARPRKERHLKLAALTDKHSQPSSKEKHKEARAVVLAADVETDRQTDRQGGGGVGSTTWLAPSPGLWGGFRLFVTTSVRSLAVSVMHGPVKQQQREAAANANGTVDNARQAPPVVGGRKTAISLAPGL